MRSRRYRGIEGEGSSYDLSISDLMAALCCVFVLFTIGITTSLKEKNMAANRYNETKVQIANVINDAITKSKAEVKKKYGRNLDIGFDENKLILRFSASAAFEEGKYDLKPSFEKDLSIVFPELMKVLYNYAKDNPDSIEDVRIEGFTATDREDADNAKKELFTDLYPQFSYLQSNNYIQRFNKLVGEGSDHDYITGFTLSQQRTMNVLSYCMLTNYMEGIPNSQKADYKQWVREHVSASGYSFIRPLDSNGEETSIAKMDKNKTRRVEIRIKTNADRVIRGLQTNKDNAYEDE